MSIDIKSLKELDWEFIATDTRYCTHNFHRYSSKFIPQIAERLITTFSKTGNLVLDVFCGSGTTLVEAKLHGRNSWGVDINPIACLVSEVKTTNISDDILDTKIRPFLREINKVILDFRTLTKRKQPTLLENQIEVEMPSFVYIDKWFQPQVLRELSIIKEMVNREKNAEIKKFLVCGFSEILRSVSNASSRYGNLMVDKNKQFIDRVFERFERQVKIMIDGMKEFNRKADRNCFARISFGDSRNLNFVESDFVDLIVTHPPYVSAVPYAEYQKLSLNWLRECFSDLFPKESIEYLEPRKLDRNIIGGMRRKDDVVDRFMMDMELVCKEMFRVLKRGGFCGIVIGHPTVRGKIVELDKQLIKFCQDEGFHFIEEITRGKYQTTMGKMKQEYILILRKP